MVNNIEDKITNISNFAATAAISSIENKMFNVSNIVKYIDYEAKVKEIESNISPHLIIINLQIIYLMQR